MYIQKFVEYLRVEKGYSPHTILAYQKDLTIFLEYLKSNYAIKDFVKVDYKHIRSWIVELMETQHKPSTINRKISSVKSLYKFLLKIGEVDNNPMAHHRSLKQDKHIAVPLSQKEIKKLYDLLPEINFETVRDKLIIDLLYTTGMRRAELISLKQLDIDLTQSQLKVLGKRQKERLIPILKQTKQIICKYLEYKKNIEVKTNNLLTDMKGDPLTDASVYKIVKNYLTLVTSKEKRSPHILRHTFATHLLDEGLDLNSVKDLLGHSSLASTQVYTHTSLKKIKGVYHKAHPRSK